MAQVFNSLLLKLKEEQSKKQFFEYLNEAKSDQERVKLVLGLLSSSQVQVELDKEIKSEMTALQLQDSGNKVYENAQDLDGAVELYTRNIVFAPEGTTVLAVAYSNRSALLTKARLYAEALKEITRALDANLPQKLRPKLLLRRLVCLRCLGAAPEDIEKADEELKKCRAELGDSEASQIPDDVGSPRILLEDDRTDFQAVDANANGISSAVTVAYTEKYGNHLVATRDIQPGEILIVEPFYACTLKESNRFRYCDYCFKRTWSAVPCRQCVSVIYCSETCRESAWKAYHDIECDVIDELFWNTVSTDGLLSLRLTIQALKQAGSLQALKDSIDALGIVDENTRLIGIDDYTKYTNVYCLKKHASHRRPIDVMAIAVEACVMLYVLSAHTNVFEGQVLPVWSELWSDELAQFLGGLIMSYTQIAMINCRKVIEVGEARKASDRGTVLLPFSSLMNHSCSTNTVRCSAGRKFVVAACDFIEKGDQVFTCYGPHHASIEKDKRQQMLSDTVFFQCDCDACEQEWPTYNQMSLSESHRMPPKTLTSLLKVHEKLLILGEMMYSGVIDNPEEILNNLRKSLKSVDRNFNRPTRESVQIMELFNDFLKLQGNRWQSLNS